MSCRKDKNLPYAFGFLILTIFWIIEASVQNPEDSKYRFVFGLFLLLIIGTFLITCYFFSLCMSKCIDNVLDEMLDEENNVAI